MDELDNQEQGLPGPYVDNFDGTVDAPKGKRKPYDINRLNVFLQGVRKTGCILKSCRRAQISSSMHYRVYNKPEYAWYREAFHDAVDEFKESLENAAVKRAVEGFTEPIFHLGEQVGERRRYSDTLLVQQLKANLPEKYGDKERHDHTGMVQVSVEKGWYGDTTTEEPDPTSSEAPAATETDSTGPDEVQDNAGG